MSRGISSFLEAVDHGKPRARSTGRRKLQEVEVAIDDAKRRAGSGEWEGARGATLVGLYGFCHELIYGVVPDELRELPTFRMASKLAAGFTHEHFEDDFGAAASFIKWAWEREKGKHNWALSNGISRNRLSWRLQFSASLLTDWKVQRHKRGR